MKLYFSIDYLTHWGESVRVVLTLVMSYALLGCNMTIGVGTLAAFLGIGRVMALFNRFVLPHLPRVGYIS